VFRIVQESLTNVAKHARATKVLVQLQPKGEQLLVSVQDDGIGFRLGAPRQPQSLGLVGLRERAALLHGEVKVDSSPGGGTRVEARVPMVGVKGRA
jgi:signal transduction histidine kinase